MNVTAAMGDVQLYLFQKESDEVICTAAISIEEMSSIVYAITERIWGKDEAQ